MRSHKFKWKHQFLEDYFKKKLVFTIYEETVKNHNEINIVIAKIINYQINTEEFIKGFEDLSRYYISKYKYISERGEGRHRIFLDYRFLTGYAKDKNPIILTGDKLYDLRLKKKIVLFKVSNVFNRLCIYIFIVNTEL